MMAEQRVKLRGVLAQTASSARSRADGSLVVELYDFSDDAHKWLGNDVAFLLDARRGAEGRSCWCGCCRRRNRRARRIATRCCCSVLAERFDDYYDVQQWLAEQGIPFRKEFEPWA